MLGCIYQFFITHGSPLLAGVLRELHPAGYDATVGPCLPRHALPLTILQDVNVVHSRRAIATELSLVLYVWCTANGENQNP